MELFKYFLRSSDSNVFVSPVSISAVLAVLLEGANGRTAAQLRLALEPRYSHLDKVTVASRVYGDWRLDVKPKFMQAVRERFELVNFSHNPEKVKNDINRWVAAITNNKITDAVDGISPDTKLLIIAAIYFEVAWRNQFVAEYTVDAEFWVTKHISKTYGLAGLAPRITQAADRSHIIGSTLVDTSCVKSLDITVHMGEMCRKTSDLSARDSLKVKNGKLLEDDILVLRTPTLKACN
ncbi:putative M151R-M001R fusion [Myxoma virus]|uniref:Putative M151R-M001R fusion n=1 Tax=Myxoma virus TaxID=10273 RepID=E2CZN9_9POXV|nr:putative M151R-M001R fusion [Myxoma virus]